MALWLVFPLERTKTKKFKFFFSRETSQGLGVVFGGRCWQAVLSLNRVVDLCLAAMPGFVFLVIFYLGFFLGAFWG